MQAAWAWGLEIVPSLHRLHATTIDLGRTLCETCQGWAGQREVPKVSGWALMQTLLHKYEEMQMRLKSQDEEDCGTGTVTTFFFYKNLNNSLSKK